MQLGKSLMHSLDTESLSIMRDIFNLTQETSAGVDMLNYRANHEDQLDVIDKLESSGFLRKENERYWVSLIALPLLEERKAKDLLSSFEKIFDALRRFYKSNQRDQLKLTDIAGIVQLPLNEIRECLSYMVEGSWWGGRSTDFYATEDTFIKPSEATLKYKTFHDVIVQMQEWAYQRISDRTRHEDNLIFAQGLRSPSLNDQIGVVHEKAARQKPDWYEKLDSEYRALLDEIYPAISMEMRALAAMGLRTVIDMACNKLVGDLRGFEEKLDALLEKGFINQNEREILAIAVDVGSASAHRGHTPNKEDLNTLLDIVEHLLKGIYVLRPASQRLKEVTPKRRNHSQNDKK